MVRMSAKANHVIGKVTQPKNIMLKVRSIKDLQAVDDECEILDIQEDVAPSPLNSLKRPVDSDQDDELKNKCRKITSLPSTSNDQINPDVLENTNLSSVQVLGVDLLYRPHGTTVVFKTEPVLALLAKALLLAEHSLSKVVASGQGVQPTSQNDFLQQDTFKKTFISAKALRAVLDSSLLDLAIRDLLLTTKETSDIVPTINGYTVILNNIEVKFKVRSGIVYLDVFSAFSVLDRLHDALSGNWASVDNQLADKGISQKNAFKKRGSVSGRSYLTLQAFKVIAEGHLGVTGQVDALLKEVEQLVEKKDCLCRELEQTVDMIIRTSCIIPRDENRRGMSKGPRLGQKNCINSACGRGYHFVRKCCSKDHTMLLGDVEVGFVRKDGKIFLENCAAFGSLGRMIVMRCSDYRKVDRTLNGTDEETSKETVERGFLFTQDDLNHGRNRRTHISLEAFITLVKRGFADPNRKDSLQNSIDKLDLDEIVCDDVEEIIDLSESDVDTEEMKCEESSSGLDSGETTSSTQRKRVRIDTLTSEEEMFYENYFADFCEILGQKVPLKVSRSNVFLGKPAILHVLNSPPVLQKGHKAMDKLMEENGVCLDEAFLYEGRTRGFISTRALKILLNSEFLKKNTDKETILSEISNIEDGVTSFADNKVLFLNNGSDQLKYRNFEDNLYLDLSKLSKIARLSPFLQSSPKNISKVLDNHGVDVDHCFHRQGKYKFAFISLHAAAVLLRVEHKEGIFSAVISALKEKGAITSTQNILEQGINISSEFPAIQYRISEGHLYLHRRSTFEILNLESAILGAKKGYAAINSILTVCGLDLQDCYLPSKSQKYSYISCLALFRLLEDKNPLIVCLSNKDSFIRGLLGQIQSGALALLGPKASLKVGQHTLGVRCEGVTLYLHRHTAYTLSGLYETEGEGTIFQDPTSLLEERGFLSQDCWLHEGEDRFGWISLHALSVLLTLEAETSEESVAWRDILSAVAIQEPRLRAKIKMDQFRTRLTSCMLDLYVQHLGKENNTILPITVDLTESSDTEATETSSETLHQPRALRRLTSSSDHVVPSTSGPSSPALSHYLHSPMPSCLPSPTGSSTSIDTWSLDINQPSITADRYNQMKNDIIAAAGGLDGTIGDWEVARADTVTKLNVRPGYGASRKISFLRPDYAAILSYSLILGPGHASLIVNDSTIPDNFIEPMLEREEKEGTLSFLYQLISLRPCFGSFSPELVETVRQWDEDTTNMENVIIDSSFIGTSGSGRTYAGTVRSRNCGLIACDRVSDFCQECKQLSRLTINRSLLGEEDRGEKRKDNKVFGNKASQKSVWQLATTTEDACRFVCPQVQSFNTSLPHAFNGSSQATAIVEHRADISNNLKVEVQLSGRNVTKRFSDFQKDRQLGPLLDWVAGLRLCVGYPANLLVRQAQFLQENMSRLKPDLQKLFCMLVVDSKFEYTVGEDLQQEGTIRSDNCLNVAEQGADICHQCRLLQEPIEFLNM